MLTVDAHKEFPGFRLSATFATEAGATALFGASGAGKTTIINMIAGLVRPDRGRVAIGDTVLFDSTAGIDLAPHRRRIGYVFQEGRLFPHLSVWSNLDYGRFMSGVKHDPARLRRVVDLLDIGHLLDRRPRHLSGGERQRVAVGRALLMEPRLLLLDEPLASLDIARKRDILPYLARLPEAGGVPIIYVTHQPAEVRHLASAVVLIEDGRVSAIGGLELLARASTDF